MEKFICKQDCKVGYFGDKIKAGQEFSVLRNIMNECVLVTEEERKGNIIAKEKELKRYGILCGTPALGGV